MTITPQNGATISNTIAPFNKAPTKTPNNDTSDYTFVTPSVLYLKYHFQTFISTCFTICF